MIKLPRSIKFIFHILYRLGILVLVLFITMTIIAQVVLGFNIVELMACNVWDWCI